MIIFYAYHIWNSPTIYYNKKKSLSIESRRWFAEIAPKNMCPGILQKKTVRSVRERNPLFIHSHVVRWWLTCPSSCCRCCFLWILFSDSNDVCRTLSLCSAHLLNITLDFDQNYEERKNANDKTCVGCRFRILSILSVLLCNADGFFSLHMWVKTHE